MFGSSHADALSSRLDDVAIAEASRTNTANLSAGTSANAVVTFETAVERCKHGAIHTTALFVTLFPYRRRF